MLGIINLSFDDPITIYTEFIRYVSANYGKSNIDTEIIYDDFRTDFEEIYGIHIPYDIECFRFNVNDVYYRSPFKYRITNPYIVYVGSTDSINKILKIIDHDKKGCNPYGEYNNCTFIGFFDYKNIDPSSRGHSDFGTKFINSLIYDKVTMNPWALYNACIPYLFNICNTKNEIANRHLSYKLLVKYLVDTLYTSSGNYDSINDKTIDTSEVTNFTKSIKCKKRYSQVMNEILKLAEKYKPERIAIPI